MRTTLTLDPDVAVLVNRAREASKRSLKEVVNDALRRGLMAGESSGQTPAAYETPATDLGGCLLPDLDDVAGALTLSEGDDFR